MISTSRPSTSVGWQRRRARLLLPALLLVGGVQGLVDGWAATSTDT